MQLGGEREAVPGSAAFTASDHEKHARQVQWMEKQWQATGKQLQQLGVASAVDLVDTMQWMGAQVQYSLPDMFVSGLAKAAAGGQLEWAALHGFAGMCAGGV